MAAVKLIDQNVCNICGSDDFRDLGFRGPSTHKWIKDLPEKNLRDPELEKVHTVQCRRCRLIWANPMPIKTDVKLQEDYGVDYLEGRETKMDPGKVVEKMDEYMQKREDRTFIDIGCGLGQFLVAARDKGWDVTGIELSAAMCRYMKGHYGFDVDNTTFEEYHTSRKFDAAVMAELLEHVHDPKECLLKLNEMLETDGIAYIYVPNEESLFHRVFRVLYRLLGNPNSINLSPTVSPYHLYGFSLFSLTELLKSTGFDILGMRLRSGDFFIKKTANDTMLSAIQKDVANLVLRACYILGQGFYVETYARKIKPQ